jgi:hypothetical protein
MPVIFRIIFFGTCYLILQRNYFHLRRRYLILLFLELRGWMAEESWFDSWLQEIFLFSTACHRPCSLPSLLSSGHRGALFLWG